MAAAVLQVISSLLAKYSKSSLLISAYTYEKQILKKDYCIDRYDDKMCRLPICSNHIILTGDLEKREELLQTMDATCFWNQHVNCLYTLSKYRFIGEISATNGQTLIIGKMQFSLRNKTKEWTESSAMRKKDPWRKTTKTLLEFLQKNKKNANDLFSVCWRNPTR